MATQLYAYRIEPGDPDHIPSYMIQEGVVEAEPDEIAQILAELEEAHGDEIAIRPIDTVKGDIHTLRVAIGRGLDSVHSPDYADTPRCATDRPYIEEWQLEDYGEILDDDAP